MRTPYVTALLAAASAAVLVSVPATALAQGGEMQAGGLAPPAPLPPEQSAPTAPSSTEQALDSSRDKDSGRGLSWVWLEAEGGLSHVGLRTFNVDEQNFSASFIPTASTGGFAGVGVGARLLFFTIGARGRVGFYDAWDVFSVGGELGFKIPLGNLEPHFELGGGYTALGAFKNAVQQGAYQQALDQISIAGFYARASAGLDYYIVPAFSIGARAGFEVLGLTRPGLDPAAIAALRDDPSISELQRQQLQLEGSSYGASGSLSGVLGLHF